MMFGFFWGDWTFLILIPAMIFALIAQARVQSTFKKYSQKASYSGLTGSQAARRLLDANGLYHVPVLRVRGHLSDHYDPRNNTLCLSDSVYDSNSAAAIGVACHEAGHAIQHARNYAPLSIRMAIIPVCNIGSNLAMPLFLIGLLFAGGSYISDVLMLAGIACFSLATLFQLITLPVEFNASKRALEGIQEHHLLYDSEIDGAKEVLSAAAMTYVAALASSLASLLRLILIAQRSRRN
jgi:Zn-dependent membrane protease YugP